MENEPAFPYSLLALHSGLSKREFYAALALHAYISKGTRYTQDSIAKDSFSFADAMIKESKRVKKNERSKLL